MLLYVSMTVFFFLLMLLGLREDSKLVAQSWPQKPQGRIVSQNMRLCHLLAFIGMFVMWALTAFRGAAIGNDTQVYIEYFQRWRLSGFFTGSRFESGYILLNVLIGRMTDSSHVFLLVVSTIMYVGLTVYIFKYSKNIPISIVMFFSCFFAIYMSMIRQGIAMMIVLYAYQALKENKKITAALLIVLASLFHKTVLACFLLFFNFKWFTKKRVVWTAAILFTIAIMLGWFRDLMLTILQRAPNFFLNYFLSSYVNGRYDSVGWLGVSYGVVRSLIWYLMASSAADENNRSERLAVTTFTFMVLFSVIGYAVSIFSRLAHYFSLIALSELPNLLYTGKLKNGRLWLLIVCTVLLIMFLLIQFFRPEWYYMYPYEFWH